MNEQRVEKLLLAVMLVSYAYFAQAGGWNHNSRFDVARSIVEHHSFNIDAFRENTGDIASFGGHFYSDKAPLTGVVAAIPYGMLFLARPLLSEGWREGEMFVRFASYVVTVSVSGLASALTARLVFRTTRAGSASLRAAAGAALVFGLGSFAFPYATVLFGHDLAAALLFAAFYVGVTAPSPRRMFFGGMLASLAAVCEYPTAGASLLVGAYLAWAHGKGCLRRVVVPFVAGAALPAVLAMVYAWICFRNLFGVGYSNVVIGAIGTVSWFGLSYPHPSAAWGLLFGLERGLFVGAPALLLCAAGIAYRRSSAKWPILCAAISAYYVLFVASYAWWDGGSCFGPRHLVPMLPFLCLGGAVAADRWPRPFLGTALVSAVLMLAGTARGPVNGEPILTTVLRAATGDVADPGVPGLFAKAESTNIGLVVGLSGAVSVLPLVVVWAVLGVKLWRATSNTAAA